MNARFDDNGNFTVPPTEHARLRAEKLARPVGTRVTRVECDTCHHLQDFTHPTGPDAHLALNAVMGGQGWTKNGTAHTCRACQQATPSTTVRLTDDELAEAARLTEDGDGDLVSDEAVAALISEVRAARAEIRALNQDLAAKGSDFDAAVRKIGELRDEVEDFQAACRSACEQRDAALEQLGKVRAHIDQRPEYITTCEDANPNADHDYYRWQGGAEARRQLAQRLDWTVPHQPGDKTGPKPTTEEARDGE